MIIDTQQLSYETAKLRMPFKFGAAIMTSMTIPTVKLSLKDGGNEVVGIGSMPLGNAWSFPGAPYEKSLEAMIRIVDETAAGISELEISENPFEASFALRELAFMAGAEVSEEMFGDSNFIPDLCKLVCYSAFDIALFDAWGKLHGENTFRLLQDSEGDFSEWIGDSFSDYALASVLKETPVARLAIFHVVGGLDPLTPEEITKPVGDGLPEDLQSWIERDGLTNFKVKMSGVEAEWDFQRIVAVDKVCLEAVRANHGRDPVYSLDMNEQCPSGTMLLELLRRYEREVPDILARVEFIEQPIKRDFSEGREDGLHEANKIKPIVLDEGLVDFESLNRALELGYNGVCLKACKGIGFSVLVAAVARERGLYVCVQDLTCPGISFVASSSLAAWVGVDGLEANARQYCPQANEVGLERMPSVFQLRDGAIHPGNDGNAANSLGEIGLSVQSLV